MDSPFRRVPKSCLRNQLNGYQLSVVLPELAHSALPRIGEVLTSHAGRAMIIVTV